MFATCAPGIGRLLRRQLAAVDGIDVTGSGFDGRSDIVFFDTDRTGRAHALRSRLAEDVFAEIGRASRGDRASPDRAAGAGSVASTAWQPRAVERALSVWADEVRQLSGSMTYRVTAQARMHARLQRPDLRRAMAAVIGADKSRWKFADPAQLDFQLSEWHDGQYVAGLRISATTERSGRSAELSGPLPATVAAAMVELAGDPTAAYPASTGILLDPCCGAGTILAEAAAAGWTAEGSDMDPAAVEAASRAAAGVPVQLGDARDLLLADDCVSACVSWLPGRSPGSWPAFAGAVLAELSRVTRSGGRVVLLAPDLPRAVIPAALRLRRQVPIQVLGTKQSIWVFHRA
ncbi:MAG TPA: methyltransferase domain-containing protein [Streptosporangiaceae bacterium]|jgi:SAM-dependent methyltransferase|nr:methyltransferase domain-containing protein [Streptosporangiaceae bacterium]